MSLLTPLGLLGLIAIIGLILIYILKPNYQQKVISSTFVWKLSLKYKRKKLPISRFRNILLLICQVLILVACALILTQPYVPSESTEYQSEKIAIIDASASMLAGDGETRFERAVNQVKSLATQSLDANGGALTVIIADSEPYYILQRATSRDIAEINTLLDELTDPEEPVCTYGTADIEGAMNLASSILLENPNTEVLLYTDNTYIDRGTVTVVNVAAENEWNAAILDCVASIIDNNYYTFDVTVGCYGRATDVTLCADIYGVNSERRTVSVRQDIRFDTDGELHVYIGEPPATLTEDAIYIMPEVSVYSYDNVFLYFENADDSFDTDNIFRLYGGTKPELRVLYCSTNANPFFDSALMGIRESLAGEWEVDYVEVQLYEGERVDIEEYCKGYDFYIFEYTMPSVMPTDGVVMLVSPDRAPNGLGLPIGDKATPREASLERGATHALTDYMTLSDLLVNEYVNVGPTDGFDELLYCNGRPVLLLKDLPATKILTMLFSVKMSYAAVLVDFPIFVGNIFEYFFPATVEKHVYDVGSSITLKARGNILQVTSDTVNKTYDTFPSTLDVLKPGVYTLEQPIMAENFASANKRSVEYIYVKVPRAESNIFTSIDMLDQPERLRRPDPVNVDIVFYFAIALVSLLFAEWLLQIKEQY